MVQKDICWEWRTTENKCKTLDEDGLAYPICGARLIPPLPREFLQGKFSWTIRHPPVENTPFKIEQPQRKHDK